MSKNQSQSDVRHPILDWLAVEMAELWTEIERQPFWAGLMDPKADSQFVQRVMSEVYQDIAGYQPHVIEAAIAAIAQMPRTLNPRLIKNMLSHQADEFDHGQMAARDLRGLGSPEPRARDTRLSPQAFAVAAVWWMIVHVRDPFAYLGALYLFEGLTPKVTELVKHQLRSKGFTSASLEYITFHSTEDIKHANLVFYLISQTAHACPESVTSIKSGFESFRNVYPIPLWAAAFERAKNTWQQELCGADFSRDDENRHKTQSNDEILSRAECE